MDQKCGRQVCSHGVQSLQISPSLLLVSRRQRKVHKDDGSAVTVFLDHGIDVLKEVLVVGIEGKVSPFR